MSKLVINKYSVDKKELSVIFTFLCWLIIGFCILFVGVNNIFAATYTPNEYYAELYNNLGPTLSKVDSYTEEVNGIIEYYYGFLGLTANSSGGAWVISSPIPIIDGHTYSMTINTYAPGCGTTILSTYNRIGLGSTINWAKTSYQENTLASELYSKSVNNTYLQYVFKAETSASYIAIPFATTSSCTSGTVHLKQVIIDDLGTGGVSESTINSSLTNQTNELNNSIQNSTNNITDAITDTESNINSNIDDMEQSIIDSNKETQEVIKDQFNNCHDSYNLLNYKIASTLAGSNITINNNYINVNGNWGISFLNVNLPADTYSMSWDFDILSGSNDTNSWRIQYTDDSYSKYINNGSSFTAIKQIKNIYIYFDYGSNNFNINVSNVMLNKGSIVRPYEPYGEEICSNKIDETNDKLNDLNSSLNDSNVDGSLGDAGSFFDNFTTSDHGGLSGIITAPLVAINQMLNTSCNPMTTTFKGKELSLPCGYEFWNKMGPIQDFVNLVLGGLLCYQIIIKLYKLIEKIKNPEDDRLEVMDL